MAPLRVEKLVMSDTDYVTASGRLTQSGQVLDYNRLFREENTMCQIWHIDGNHSLICWRFVIDGGIDGYSHMITYLHC